MLQTQNGKLEIRIIVGAEIQSHVHYAMPIRNLEYDALNLSRQLSARQKYNRENHLFWYIHVTRLTYDACRQ